MVRSYIMRGNGWKLKKTRDPINAAQQKCQRLNIYDKISFNHTNIYVLLHGYLPPVMQGSQPRGIPHFDGTDRFSFLEFITLKRRKLHRHKSMGCTYSRLAIVYSYLIIFLH